MHSSAWNEESCRQSDKKLEISAFSSVQLGRESEEWQQGKKAGVGMTMK